MVIFNKITFFKEHLICNCLSLTIIRNKIYIPLQNIKEITMHSKFLSSGLISNDSEYIHNQKPKNAKKKIINSHRVHDNSYYDHLSPKLLTISTVKNIPKQEQFELDQDEYSIEYFQNKYGEFNSQYANLQEELVRILTLKDNQIKSLRIYRDQLKFINNTNSFIGFNQTKKISITTLKRKAVTEQVLNSKKISTTKMHNDIVGQAQIVSQYLEYLTATFGDKHSTLIPGEMIDIDQQQQLIINNLLMETDQLNRDFIQSKKRNTGETKQIKDDILALRIQIKQKQDRLKDMKEKMCTMYMKVNNRNNVSKGKGRNMSISVKKFNNQNHSTLKQVYIGNKSFKNYSKQILEKVTTEDELLRIRFIYIESGDQNNKRNNIGNPIIDKFTFQCIYKSQEGVVHEQSARENYILMDKYNDITRDKISEESCVFQEIQAKYLLSLKFFYKSKIVGVQCRIKTDRGNKHLQLGCCSPNIEHELLTLVNKRIVTLGSFWHHKSMIGVSVWYKDKDKVQAISIGKTIKSRSQRSLRPSTEKDIRSSNAPQTKNRVFQEYYA